MAPDVWYRKGLPGQRSQSLRAGGVRVAIGLAFFAVTTYVFLALAARGLGTVRYDDFAVFWGVVYGVGLGTFGPFEQEVSRRVAERRAAGGTGDAVQRTAYRIGLGTIGLLAVVLLVVVPAALKGTFHDDAILWTACAASLFGLCGSSISRGAFSARREFGRYSAQLGLEGLVRLLAAGGLFLLSVRTPWAWAFAIPAALAVSVLFTAHRPWGHSPTEPHVAIKDLGASLMWVVISSVIAQVLINFGPVVVRLLGTDADKGLAGRFLAAALIARTPVFLFAAVQAVLMPALVAALVKGDRAAFARNLRRVLLPVLGIGVLGIVVCAAAGPDILRLALGKDYVLPRSDVTLLAVAMGLYLGTLVLQPAAIALRRHRQTAVAWAAAGATFIVACFLPFSAVRTVELAMVAACAVAIGGLALVVRRAMPPESA